MSGQGALNVRPHEQGCIRIFGLDISGDDLQNLRAPKKGAPATGAALAQMLGLDWLNEDFIEIFEVCDLGALGLAGYLEQGNGVTKTDVNAHHKELDAVTGWVVILYSSAFDGAPATLRPNRQLCLIGMWHEDRDDIDFGPLPSRAATQTISLGAAASPPNAHLTVLWAVLALPFLALVIGAVIIGMSR